MSTLTPFFTPAPDVAVDITNRCNLHCRHCYNFSGEKPVQELAIADATRLIAELRDLGQERLRLSGGEPTLHPQFGAIVREATGRGMVVAISTNGVFGRTGRQRLKALSLGSVSVSLDGMRIANDQVRGPGVFDEVMRSIRFLKDICPHVLISTHLFRSNLADVTPLIELAQELAVGIKFAPLRPIGRANLHMRDQIPSPAEYRGAVETIGRLRAQYPAIDVRTDFDVLSPQKPSSALPAPSRAVCPAGRSRLNVSYDGRIYPCAFLATPEREFAIGRLGEIPLLDLWNRSPVLTQFRNIRKDNRCQGCNAYGNECVGGCVAMAYFATGHLDGQDPVCFVSQPTSDTPAQPHRRTRSPVPPVSSVPNAPVDIAALIRAIRDLRSYTDAEWREWLGYFSIDVNQAALADQTQGQGPDLLSRIITRKGIVTGNTRPDLPKLVPSDRLPTFRARGQCKIGMVSGCFDLLHLGHLRGMRYAKRFLADLGGDLFAVTQADQDIRAKKGSDRPIMNLAERLTLLSAVRYVDHVAVLTQPNCLAVIRTLKPDYYFKSKADRAQAVVVEEMELVESLGGQVVLFPDEESRWKGTTRIIEELRITGQEGIR